MDSGDVCLCYVSLGPREDAQAIARTLVEERLAAAVNLLPGMRSVYRWEGTVAEASEILLIAKSTTALLPRLTERVVALHSYRCPAVIALPVIGGHPDYLAWIATETG